MILFLKPTPAKIYLFILFLFILVGAHIQGWAFTPKQPWSEPKPPFYDLLAPFPIWVMWFYLTIPLMMVLQGNAILSELPSISIVLLNSIYFYLLSCCIVIVMNKLNGHKESSNTR